MRSMAKRYGGQSMVGRLERVLVRRPESSFRVSDPEVWNYSAIPDLASAREEHDQLVEILRREGIAIEYHDAPLEGLADSIYVFDPVLMTDHGAVVLKMGKDLRRGEERALQETLDSLGIPTLGGLEGMARAEGGDLLWLDRNTLIAGLGFRTNSEGARQLRRLLEPIGIEVSTMDLPYDSGPIACLHLLSLISLIDHDLAVVYPPLMPVRLWQELERRGFETIEAPPEEYRTMATNVLALAPRICLMLEGNRSTQSRLERAGCTVHTYRGTEISLKAEGGPTCLTRPLLRRS